MKKLTTAAILVGGAIMASQSGFAQSSFVADDLYFGFENNAGGGSADYIINLGSASSIINSASVVNLDSSFSLSSFNSVLGSSSSMLGGVVGGNSFFASPDIYATQLRAGGTPSPMVAGSIAPPTLSIDQTENAVNKLSNLNAPGTGPGILDSTKSWESYVEPTFTGNSFYGESGVNPDSAVGDNGVYYMDLYMANNGSAYTYEGFFALDTIGGGGLSFNPEAVPEPASYALAGVGGLLLLAFRRRFIGKNASFSSAMINKN